MEFITKNGQKKVTINFAPFKDTTKLKTEAMKCIQKVDKNQLLDINNIKALDTIINILIVADTSSDFESALYKCLAHCVYDGFYNITPQFFDDKPEAIEDYYEIAAKCIEVNLTPFYKSLVTAFKAYTENQTTLNTQK